MIPKKILLVDDSETILQFEEMILEQANFHVVKARDGSEGIKKARELKPDLILMDVVMPGIDGFEALRRLRHDAGTQRIPVVMVTSRAEAESMEIGYGSGCNDYVIKPIDATELTAKVKNLLDG